LGYGLDRAGSLVNAVMYDVRREWRNLHNDELNNLPHQIFFG